MKAEVIFAEDQEIRHAIFSGDLLVILQGRASLTACQFENGANARLDGGGMISGCVFSGKEGEQEG